MSRGQVSVEYLVIVGIALGLLIPAVFFFFSYQRTIVSGSAASQINDLGTNIVGTALQTYALGKNARQTLEVTIPAGVRSIGIAGNSDELVIRYETDYGMSDAVFFSTIPLESLTPGLAGAGSWNITVDPVGATRIQLLSVGQKVNITEVS